LVRHPSRSGGVASTHIQGVQDATGADHTKIAR